MCQEDCEKYIKSSKISCTSPSRLKPKPQRRIRENRSFQKNLYHPLDAYFQKEMMRNGITLKSLWNEYCEECRQSNELPLIYSQFCFHYQKQFQLKMPPCTYPGNPGYRLKWIGLEILTVLSIPIQERSVLLYLNDYKNPSSHNIQWVYSLRDFIYFNYLFNSNHVLYL